jgi:hypothetical protein
MNVSKTSGFVHGRLDMLLLEILPLEAMNGFAIIRWLSQVSSEVSQASDGSLHTALHKPEQEAALMLGSDESRGYCLELNCADFLAEATLEAGAENISFLALARLIGALPVGQRLQLLDMVRNGLEPIQTEVAATEA